MKIFNFFILGRAPTGRAAAGYPLSVHYEPKPDYYQPDEITFQDTFEKIFYNYEILASNKILGKYLATVYRFQMEHFTLEIRDSSMNLVDVFDLNPIDPITFSKSFDGYFNTISLCIHDDSLLVLGLENDQIIIKKYKIEGTDL